MNDKIENCYQCTHYHSCHIRFVVERLLDEGHYDLVVGGRAILKNSIPLPFLEKLAAICNIKEG